MGEAIGFYAVQFLNGLSFSMLLLLLAAGLSISFGLMDVLNLAHGSFYMLGAYLAYSFVQWTGNFWLALAVAPVAVGLLGLAVEERLLRPLYRRGHLDQVLLTFGLAFIASDLVRWIWGAQVRSLPLPKGLEGSVPLFGTVYPSYRLFVIGLGFVLALSLWLFIERTRLGAIVRAGVSDKEMAEGLGVPIGRVFTAVFAFGAALAALSGVIAGPFMGLYPGMDFETLILTLIVVVVGGLGTLHGAFWGALLIGQADTFGKVLFPRFAMVMIYAVMAAVLLWRGRNPIRRLLPGRGAARRGRAAA